MATNKPVTKKLINSVERCVDDNLRGLVAIYPKLRLHAKHRVVTIRSKSDSGKVSVIGGGGSGHEPFTAGFVGAGMLDGAVAGGIFASPPTGHVLYAITHLHKYNSGGTIIIFGNYTGDRLTFGKAIEKAKAIGIKVEAVIVGEDVASSHNKTGGRGLVGDIYLFKMCGAMSAMGYDLPAICEMAQEVCKNIATLGLCLSPCSLPGQPPLFDIPHDEVVLGAGAHGEGGITRIKMGTAKEMTEILLEKIITHMKLVTGDRVAVLCNNLGGTSVLEANIVCAEIKDYLASKGIKLERLFSGHMLTTLEMRGVHISLLNLRPQADFWLRLLDAPTAAPGWTGGQLSVRTDDDNDDF